MLQALVNSRLLLEPAHVGRVYLRQVSGNNSRDHVSWKVQAKWGAEAWGRARRNMDVANPVAETSTRHDEGGQDFALHCCPLPEMP